MTVIPLALFYIKILTFIYKMALKLIKIILSCNYFSNYFYPFFCWQIDYPEVHGGRMHRPPHPHPITDHRQVNLVFDDTVNIRFQILFALFSDRNCKSTFRQILKRHSRSNDVIINILVQNRPDSALGRSISYFEMTVHD